MPLPDSLSAALRCAVQFLLSMGPFTGHKDQFLIDAKDDAVRGALVLEQGEMRWPAPPLTVSQPASLASLGGQFCWCI